MIDMRKNTNIKDLRKMNKTASLNKSQEFLNMPIDLRKNNKTVTNNAALDLRKMTKMAVNIKPSASKENDFNLALAEYLYKELKSKGLNVNKKNVILNVKLSNKVEDKYENIVIDCLEGKLFLRGKEVKDKYFGRLSKFNGSHKGEAYQCMVESAQRIINRIEKIEDELNNSEREIIADIERIDMRKNAKRIDLRKNASLVKNHINKTLQHRKDVCTVLDKIIIDLKERGKIHDESKLQNEEAPIYAMVDKKFEGVEYNSKEYKEILKELNVALEHHYESNSHHPEHYENGIEDMDLIDLIEMFADWTASAKRKNENLAEGIDINEKKFNISKQLISIFKNTIKLFD